MINWIPLTAPEQVQEIINRSQEIPCVIFKHSTSCSISSMARYRLENSWDIDAEQVELYFLDLIRFRNISNFIAETFGIRHESPQAIMIHKGVVVHHNSHLDISVDSIKANIGISASI